MLQLTPKAGDAVRSARSRAGKDDAGLRIMVESGGCAGLKYLIGLETARRDGDLMVETSGVTVFVDVDSAPHIGGLQVDFVEGVAGSGFVFNNPNVTKSCACGKSFGTC